MLIHSHRKLTRERHSLFADFDSVVVIGHEFPRYHYNDNYRLRRASNIAKTITTMRHARFTIPLIYTGALPLNTSSSIALDSIHYINNPVADLQTQISRFMDYLKNSKILMRNIVIVCHAYQVERISRIISCNAQLSKRSREFNEVNFFLYGIGKTRIDHPIQQFEISLIKRLNNTPYHLFSLAKSISNNIYSSNTDILLAESFKRQITEIIYFNALRANTLQRIDDLSTAMNFDRYTVTKINDNFHFIDDLNKLKLLSLEAVNYSYLKYSDIKLLGEVFYQLAIFSLFSLKQLRMARKFCALSLQLFFISAERCDTTHRLYLQEFINIKINKENAVTKYQDTDIFFIESQLNEQMDANHQNQVKTALTFAFLMRCKAKYTRATNVEAAKLFHEKVIHYLYKLPIKDFAVNNEIVLHYMDLSELMPQLSVLKKEYMLNAAYYLDFTKPTLIQAHWWIMRAKFAYRENIEDPLDYLDKAKIIINQYFNHDENVLSQEYLRLFAEVYIQRGQFERAKDMYARVIQINKIINRSVRGIISDINYFVKAKVSQAEIATLDKDEFANLANLQELFNPYLNDDVNALFADFFESYFSHHESLSAARNVRRASSNPFSRYHAPRQQASSSASPAVNPIRIAGNSAGFFPQPPAEQKAAPQPELGPQCCHIM